MKVLFTGATGFLGQPLVEHLAVLGHTCAIVTRDIARASAMSWPRGTTFATWDRLPVCEAAIHLAGSSPVGWWTRRRRAEIRASRVETTRRLVGWYGHRPGEILTEDSPPDPRNRFRSQVCRAWEAAANETAAFGTRVVNLRIGNVFHPSGGYLGKVLPLFRCGFCATLGDRAQMLSWISLADAAHLIAFALENDTMHGPLNVTGPNPITQSDFACGVAKACHRRVLCRLPRTLLRMVLGEFASAILDDQHIVPRRAEALGFHFSHPAWRLFLAEHQLAEQCMPDTHFAAQENGWQHTR